MCNIDWNQLREKYYQDCVEIMPDNTVKLNYGPHDLFEWMKRNIEGGTVPARSGQGSLFGDMDDKEVVFWESPAYSKEFIKSHFINEIHTGIDIDHYYRALDNWASGLPKRDKRRKKSSRGWIKTMCNFMESDKKAGKLQMVETDPQVNRKKMLKFLSE